LIAAWYLIGALVLAGAGLAMDRLAMSVIRPGLRLPERTVPDLGVEHEDFTIRSGRHELHAWLLEPGPPHPREPLIVLAHGWGASYGTVLQLAEPLASRGHDVLLFDVRGHGRNGALPYVTLRDFRDDLMAVVRYAEERFPGRRIVLVGHSLGGAAGVLAAAEGSPIDGLVLIAAPGSILDVTAEYLEDQGMPGRFMVRALRPFWWIRIGSSFRPLTPFSRIGELKLPLLIIQPEHDQRVARHHAEKLSAAAGKPYVLVEGCEHTDVLASPVTLKLVEDFLASLPV